MTKKIFAAIIIFIASFSCVSAQEKLTIEQKSIQKVVIDMFQSLSDRDVSKLKMNCTPDILLLENGILWNMDSLIQKMNENKTIPDFTRINTIDFINTNIAGNVAWLSYNNQAEITKNGKHVFIRWLETAILIKEEGAWKIKVLHVTRKT